EGAHRMAQEDADKYKLPVQSVAGVYAALSPQKLWDMNVYLAKAVLDIYHTKQNAAWDEKLERTAQRIWTPKKAEQKEMWEGVKSHISEGKAREDLTEPNERKMWDRQTLLNSIVGHKLSDLDDPMAKAMWIRTYDEAYGKRHFDELTPDGRVVGTYK